MIANLNTVEILFKFNNKLGFAEVFLNDKNVESEIRTLEVSQFVSQVSEISEVRRMLVKQQQQMGINKGVVMDGRDIGTVVFPEAELKIFMTASAETRAKRRFQELLEKGANVGYDEVLENVTSRDKIDTTREDSPLTKANDAIEIDNSYLSIEEQYKVLLELAEETISNKA